MWIVGWLIRDERRERRVAYIGAEDIMTMSNHNVYSFAIPSDNMSDLTTKFTKLARRARRLSLPEPTFHEVRTERKILHEGTLSEKVILLHHIVVDPGVVGVSVSGWTFAAVIQHTDEANILSNVSGDDLPNKYRSCGPQCDHCHTLRNRKDTYIVKNDTTGEYKQVGRSCLSDFFGHDALMYAEQAQLLVDIKDQCESLEDWCGGGGNGPAFERIEKYLGHVAECIAKEGWLSRGKAREQGKEGQATADIAARHMDQLIKFPLYTTVSEESHKLAASAIEWAESIEGEDVNEYIHNIRTIARSGVVAPKTFGMAASIVSSYQREVVRQLELKRLASLPPSQHVGEVGEKLIVEVLVEKVLTFDNEFGTTKLHLMSDKNGNKFTWWCSGAPFDTGAEITICGSVKKHDIRNGVKQTVLTRCVQVELKTYTLNYNGQVYERKVICEADFKKLAKEELGIKRWSKDLKVVESSLSL